MAKRHHVDFIAKKKIPEEVQVDFTTKDGKHVSFEAEKKVTEEVEVSFMANNKKK